MGQSRKYFLIGLFFLIVGFFSLWWAIRLGLTFSRSLVFIMFFFFALIFIKNAIQLRRR